MEKIEIVTPEEMELIKKCQDACNTYNSLYNWRNVGEPEAIAMKEEIDAMNLQNKQNPRIEERLKLQVLADSAMPYIEVYTMIKPAILKLISEGKVEILDIIIEVMKDGERSEELRELQAKKLHHEMMAYFRAGFNAAQAFELVKMSHANILAQMQLSTLTQANSMRK